MKVDKALDAGINAMLVEVYNGTNTFMKVDNFPWWPMYWKNHPDMSDLRHGVARMDVDYALQCSANRRKTPGMVCIQWIRSAGTHPSCICVIL